MNEPKSNGHSNEDSDPSVNIRISTSKIQSHHHNTKTENSDEDYSKGSSLFLCHLDESTVSNQAHESVVESTTRNGFGNTLEESSLERRILSAGTAGAVVASLKSDLCHSLKTARVRKKSEEGKRFESKSKRGSGKQAGIPVGIAVAWQRHVTNSGGTTSSSTTTTAYSKHHHRQVSPTRTMSSPPLSKPKRSQTSPNVIMPVPMTPAEDSEHLTKAPSQKFTKSLLHRTRDAKSSSPTHCRNNSHSPKRTGNHVTSMAGVVKGQDTNSNHTSRGNSSAHDIALAANNNNSNTSGSSYYTSTYGYNNPYGDWTSQLLVPNSSQQSYNTTVAAYMQQLSMQPQLQYSYNNLSSYMYGGYTAEQIHQYEQFLLQQHQEQFERHQEQRRTLDFDLRHQNSTPIPALSPRISIPSPSPNSPAAGGIPYGAHQNFPWASDLYHHHNPMTLVSSTATLSPRSLASSTPSPITTYESHSYLLNRKCITPNPAPLKQFPLFSSPFSPSILPGKDIWREVGPVSLVTHKRKPSISPVAEDFENETIEETGGDEEVIDESTGSVPVESIVKQERQTPHDFSRLESLIEKRGAASVCLLTHASTVKKIKKEKRKLKIDELGKFVRKVNGGRRKRKDSESTTTTSCDGKEIKVPESVSNLTFTCDHKSDDVIIQSQKIYSRGIISESVDYDNSQHHPDREKYFLPIDAPNQRSEENIYTVEHSALLVEVGHEEKPSDFNILPINPPTLDSQNLPVNLQIPAPVLTPGEFIVYASGSNVEPSPSSTVSFLVVDNNKEFSSHCDSDIKKSVGTNKPTTGGGATSNTSDSNFTKVNSNNLVPFPKIVISSEESHLNLLATVAQEIGSYISMNPNPTALPRRFDNLDNMIEIQSDEELSRRRLSDASSTTSLTSHMAQSQSIIMTNIDNNSLAPDSNYNNNKSIMNGEAATFTRIETTPPESLEESKSDNKEEAAVELLAFQLKIPQIVPRLLKEKQKPRTKTKVLKKLKTKEPIRMKSKSPRKKFEETSKNQMVKLVKSKESNSIPKKAKSLIKKKSEPVKKSLSKKIYKKKVENGISSNPLPFEFSPIFSPSVDESNTRLTSASIYDFDFEDVKTSLGSFKEFTTEKYQSSSNVEPKGVGLKKKLSLTPSKSKSSLLKHKDLNKKSPSKIMKKSQKTKTEKSKEKSNVDAIPVVKRKRPPSSEKSVSPTRKKYRTSINSESTNHVFSTNKILTNEKSLFLKTTLDSVTSASFLNTDSNTSFSNDSCNSTWTTNPTHAVTAVKLGPEIIKTCPSLVNGRKSTSLSRRKAVKVKKDESQEMCLAKELEKIKLSSSIRRPTTEENSNPILNVKSRLTSFTHFSPKRKKGSMSPHHHIKPCLKTEPVVRTPILENQDILSESDTDELLDLNDENGVFGTTTTVTSSPAESLSSFSNEENKSERLKIRKPSIDMNIFSRRVKSTDEEKEEKGKEKAEKGKEEEWNENVVIGGVEEMIDEMRVLTEIQGLFYTGKLNALQPPDVYGVTLDNERGAPPHIIFSAEEVLEKCIREAKPWKPSQLPLGLRICAYWSPMYSGLYPGRVSPDYNLYSDLVPVEFDDGDTGVIKIGEIRLLSPEHPVREYDPNPLLTLEKKHRKRRHSSAAGSQNACTGEHEEDDCGEAYCAKIAKLQDTEEEEYSPSYKFWAWSGLGYKMPKTKQNRHKEFFPGIRRGEEIINVGDSAIFISNQQNRRPFLGRVEKFWEKKGLKSVTVRWFYHPEEAKVGKKIPSLKYPGALFESPHIDDNDVQTIAKKCEVLPFQEFKEKYGHLFTTKSGKSHKNPKGVYYLAGYYDPFTCKLEMKDLK